eukprot:g11275.t1
MSDLSLVINMLADISPAGVLPLAFGMSGTGYIPSIMLLLLFGTAAAYMMFLVSRTIEIAGVKSYDRLMVIRYADGSYLPGGQYHGFPRPSGHVANFGIASLLLVNNLSIAFLCHYNGCKYYREFVDHRPGKFGRRVFTAFMLASVLFATTMLLGYATFGDRAEGVVLNNYAKEDMLANIARFGMGFANVFSLPLMFSGLREATLVLLATAVPDTVVFDQVWFQNALSALMLGVIAVLGIIVTDVSTVIGLVGAICGSAIIYVIPCLLFDRASSKFLGLGDERAHPYDARMALRSALTRIEIGPIDSAGATTATRLLDSEGTAQPGHVEVYAYRSAIQEVYNKI